MTEEMLEALACKTQENMKDEAQAVKGYTEQSALIRAIAEQHPEKAAECEKWAEITDELISDELNHQNKLNALYTEITSVAAATD